MERKEPQHKVVHEFVHEGRQCKVLLKDQDIYPGEGYLLQTGSGLRTPAGRFFSSIEEAVSWAGRDSK